VSQIGFYLKIVFYYFSTKGQSKSNVYLRADFIKKKKKKKKRKSAGGGKRGNTSFGRDGSSDVGFSKKKKKIEIIKKGEKKKNFKKSKNL